MVITLGSFIYLRVCKQEVGPGDFGLGITVGFLVDYQERRNSKFHDRLLGFGNCSVGLVV